MAVSPTQRTLKRLKESEDYLLVQVVEKWNAFARIRQDLWCFDILAIKKDGNTVAIQVTTKDNMNARIRKIADAESTPHLRTANWTLLVEGWKKVDNKWKSFITDVS
jgi:hypothetical protein|tara:strand:+ start:694 stop:1014 length:321 start_codon:yes stop_codon:yes gene_type:complete